MSTTPTGFLEPLRRASATTIAFALLAVIFVSCGDDEGSKFIPFQPQPDSTQDSTRFVGFLADGNQGARLDIIIDGPSLAPGALRSRAAQVPTPTVAAVGILRWPGGDVALTGVYNTTADTLYLAGGGRELRGSLTETGTVAIFDGTATTPSGPAGFMALHDSDTLAVARAWVGTFQADTTSNSGTLCFLQSNWSVLGHAFDSGASAPMIIQGTIYSGGATYNISFGDPYAGYAFDADGIVNITTGSGSGNYTVDITDDIYGTTSNGAWTATRR